MSPITANRTWATTPASYRSAVAKVPSAGQAAKAASAAAGDWALFESGQARQEMLAMNAGVDQASRANNALTTAKDAIGVIGGVLGNVQAVLSAATNTSGGTIDTATEQSRIDSAITTIDALASSTTFGGKTLLNGTFTVSTPGGAVTLPSFLSSSLGSTSTGAAAGTLDTLKTGGANDLSSGNLAVAGAIVGSALSQFQAAQQTITAHLDTAQTSAPSPMLSTPPSDSQDLFTAESLSVTAAQMLAHPMTSSSAVANSPHATVLALLSN